MALQGNPGLHWELFPTLVRGIVLSQCPLCFQTPTERLLLATSPAVRPPECHGTWELLCREQRDGFPQRDKGIMEHKFPVAPAVVPSSPPDWQQDREALMAWRGPWPSAQDDGKGHPQHSNSCRMISLTAGGSSPENRGYVRESSRIIPQQCVWSSLDNLLGNEEFCCLFMDSPSLTYSVLPLQV